MKLSDTSIKRPIFTAMIMMAIVVIGAVMYRTLSVDLFPKVDFPIMTITVVYPGADPETMESKVADPIEEAVNSLSGIDQLRSTSTRQCRNTFFPFHILSPVHGRTTCEVCDCPNDGSDHAEEQRTSACSRPF